METFRFAVSPAETRAMPTAELRSAFLMQGLSERGQVNWTYTHYDRTMIGVAMPAGAPIGLQTLDELRTPEFLDRRELGIINVGGPGTVRTQSEEFRVEKLDCLYLGKGTRGVHFTSADAGSPAVFFLFSAPAHRVCTNVLRKAADANQLKLGDVTTANQRTIYQYIYPGAVDSCQVVMGLTILEPGSVWNTMPAHTHTRRMEAYFYFGLPEEHRVFHFMGEPSETRHLVVANHEAIVSPPWSIHSGCGTTNYGFIWAMAGENDSFTDMDAVAIGELK